MGWGKKVYLFRFFFFKCVKLFILFFSFPFLLFMGSFVGIELPFWHTKDFFISCFPICSHTKGTLTLRGIYDIRAVCKQSVWLSFRCYVRAMTVQTHTQTLGFCLQGISGQTVVCWLTAGFSLVSSPLHPHPTEEGASVFVHANACSCVCLCFQQECRARKNFSSLYAVVSALKSNPIHRLRRTWHDTDRCGT